MRLGALEAVRVLSTFVFYLYVSVRHSRCFERGFLACEEFRQRAICLRIELLNALPPSIRARESILVVYYVERHRSVSP